MTLLNQTRSATKADMDSSLLGQGPEWWNIAMLVMLGVVVFALCLLAAAATGVIIVQRKDVAAQVRALDEYKTEATQKIAEARAIAAQAVERAAAANERTALLERQSHELHGRNLALEQELHKVVTPAPHAEPGVPSREAFLAAIKTAEPGRADISYVRECADCLWLAEWVESALKHAGWNAKGAGLIAAEPAAVKESEQQTLPAGAHSWTVTVVSRYVSRTGHKAKRPWEAFVDALSAALGQAADISVHKEEELADDHIKIAIAPRT